MLKTSRGFSLIELMVGMAIFGILLALAAPSFSSWIRNAKIRTTAESMLNGLQLARAEAVKRNSTVRFQLTDKTDDTCALDTAGPNWVVSMDDVTTADDKCNTPASDTTPPRIIQLRNGAESSDNTTALLSGQTSFAFSGMGRLISTPASIVVSNSTSGLECIADGGTVRCLQVVVTAGGQIRMCDPALPTTDAQGC